MTDLTLSDDSSPSEVYTACATYQQLRARLPLRCVAKLLSCIIKYNSKHKLHDTLLAFTQHRTQTLNGSIHKRGRILVPVPAPVPAHDDVAARAANDLSQAARRHAYDQQLLASMHQYSQQIKDKRIFEQKRWLCDSAMDLALHSFNKRQGVDGAVLYLSSQLLLTHVDLAADSVVCGRRVSECAVLVKCFNLNKNHWMVAVWSRLHPSTVHTLDSMVRSPRTLSTSRTSVKASPPAPHIAHFLTLVQSLAACTPVITPLEVSQQRDGSSCGLFALEFCRVLCAADADIGDETTLEQLRCVDTTGTRGWLRSLSNTLDVPMRDPSYRRSTAAKRQRTGGLEGVHFEVVE